MLELPQVRSWLSSQLLHEKAPGPLERIECLALLAVAVQRQHQQSMQLLAQRVHGGEPAEFGDYLAVPAQMQLGIDASFDRQLARPAAREEEKRSQTPSALLPER